MKLRGGQGTQALEWKTTAGAALSRGVRDEGWGVLSRENESLRADRRGTHSRPCLETGR